MKNTKRMVAAPPVTFGTIEITPVVRVREVAFGSRFGGVRISAVRAAAIEIRDGTQPVRSVAVRDYRPWIRLGALVVAVALLVRRSDD